MRPLALHQLTVLDVDPLELVSIAAAVGCEGVCIFTCSPEGRVFPTVTQALKRDMLTRMNDHGISVTNFEYFSIFPHLDMADFEPGIALGAELGGKRIVTHVQDWDDSRAIEKLGRLAELASGYGLDVGLEFMGLAPPCTTIQRAVYFAQQVNRPNLGIAVDALHLMRSGGSPEDVAALPPALVKYSQICDGTHLSVTTDYRLEAVGGRTVPGDGCFPLVELLKALPPTAALDVEVPQPRDRPALERATGVVAGTRRLMKRAGLVD